MKFARYMITDRRAVGGLEALIKLARCRMAEGISAIQIREKDLDASELYQLTKAIVALPNPAGTRVLVNGRLDVALAAGADGVHLPAGSPEPRMIRALCPADFLIGISCHDSREIAMAQEADYVLLAPIFKPVSKRDERTPLGLNTLAESVRASRVPIVALGGISRERIDDCIAAGAAGVAGISLFL